jgi:hypothetical protein
MNLNRRELVVAEHNGQGQDVAFGSHLDNLIVFIGFEIWRVSDWNCFPAARSTSHIRGDGYAI